MFNIATVGECESGELISFDTDDYLMTPSVRWNKTKVGGISHVDGMMKSSRHPRRLNLPRPSAITKRAGALCVFLHLLLRA